MFNDMVSEVRRSGLRNNKGRRKKYILRDCFVGLYTKVAHAWNPRPDNRVIALFVVFVTDEKGRLSDKPAAVQSFERSPLYMGGSKNASAILKSHRKDVDGLREGRRILRGQDDCARLNAPHTRASPVVRRHDCTRFAFSAFHLRGGNYQHREQALRVMPDTRILILLLLFFYFSVTLITFAGFYLLILCIYHYLPR